MMTLDEKIVAIWYLNTIPNKQDWMAAIREIEPDSKYELTYRFRYYKDDKSFDSEDKKNWYAATCTGTRSYCIASLRSVAKEMKRQTKTTEPLYELLNEHGLKQFMREFQDLPFVFMRRVDKS